MTPTDALTGRALAAVRTRAAVALRARIAGDDADRRADRIWGRPGERWFTPDDVIWRVHADTSMFVGGIRALLLQSLHPGAMAGVADHSGYRSDPWGRLQRTSQYIATTTYGTVADAEALVGAIRQVHTTVTGTTEDGLPYAANDPHLLRWVHLAEAESFLVTYQRFGARPLTAAECDAYVAQSAVAAQRLGATELPRTLAGLRAALDGYRPELHATAASRDAARYLLRTPPLPGGARLGYWTLAAGAVATLPAWARADLGISAVETGLAARLGGPLARAGTATTRWVMSDPRVANESRSRAAGVAAGS